MEEDRGDAEDDTEELEEAVDSDDDVIRDLVVLVVLLLNLCRSVSDLWHGCLAIISAGFCRSPKCGKKIEKGSIADS